MFNFHISDVLRSLNKSREMNSNRKESNLEQDVNQKVTRFYNRIQTRLIMIFFIPVILIILLGVISYQKSAEGLNNKQVNSAVTNLDMLGNYLTLGFQTIETKSNVLASNTDIKKYYSGYFEKSTIDKMSTYRDIKSYIFSNALSEWYVNNICIFGKFGDGVATKGTIRGIDYADFLETELGKKLSDSKENGMWIASHSDLDEQLGNSVDSYSLSYISKFSYDLNNKQIGYVIVDVSNDFVEMAFQDLKVTQGSIAGFIVGDEKEILQGADNAQFQFAKQSFYKEAMASEEAVINKYISYGKKDYLFICNKLDSGNSTLCVLIPKSQIMTEANNIRNITIIVVLAACIIAILTGTLVAGDMSGVIKKLNEVMMASSKGDLTKKVLVKRKDEFHILSGNINHMIESVMSLIYKITHVSDSVSKSSENVALYSDRMLKGSETILSGIDNIEMGIVHQAEDAQHCLEQMSVLADDISQIYGRMKEIETVSESSNEIIEQGIQIMNNLSDKSNDTSNITKIVLGDIEKLDKQSQSINGIVNTISEIANRTNLLSLNASIEAARAGDAGRGFAVVAQEIRLLANQSNDSVKMIEQMIKEIGKQTKLTVASVKQEESVVASQEAALDTAIQAFSDIKQRVDTLTDNIRQITTFINNMEKSKDDTLLSIENISSMLEETSAVAGEFGNTAKEQMRAVEILNAAAKELEQNSSYLQQAVGVFKIRSLS